MLIELAVVLIVRVRWTDAEQQDCWPNETQRWSPPNGPNRRPHKVLSPLALAADWILLNSILAAWTLQASPRETRTHCKAPALVSRCRRVGAIWLDEAALIFFSESSSMFYHWPISQCESRDLSRLVSRSVLAWLVDQTDGWRKKVFGGCFQCQDQPVQYGTIWVWATKNKII